MSVILPDGDDYRVRRRGTRDDRTGFPVPDYPDDPDWTGEGRAEMQADKTWTVALDPSAWPLAYGDLVVHPAGIELLVRTAVLEPFEDPTGAFAEVRVVNLVCEPRGLVHDPTESEA